MGLFSRNRTFVTPLWRPVSTEVLTCYPSELNEYHAAAHQAYGAQFYLPPGNLETWITVWACAVPDHLCRGPEAAEVGIRYGYYRRSNYYRGQPAQCLHMGQRGDPYEALYETPADADRAAYDLAVMMASGEHDWTQFMPDVFGWDGSPERVA